MEDRGFSDLISTATSLLNSQSHSSNPSQSQAATVSSANSSSSSSSHAHKPSYNEVYASAQVVMNAAKNKFQKADSSSADDFDYGKLAGAAGMLINAASHYGKLDETGAGKYAQKAQDYLHAYEMKHGKPGTTVPVSPSAASTGYGKPDTSAPPSQTAASTGFGQSYAPSEANYGKPSAPSQGGYPTAYPPQGYPDAQQGYGYASQGYNKPAESQVNVDNYPPAGYPPAGYPSSGSNYPSSGAKYNSPPAGYPSSGGNYNQPSRYS